MAVVTMKSLLEAGVHFGHQTKKWNPKMSKYIYAARNDIHIIDLQISVEQIEKALNYFLMNMEEAQNMAQRAYIYACENYNIEKVFSEHEKIWNSLRKQQL